MNNLQKPIFFLKKKKWHLHKIGIKKKKKKKDHPLQFFVNDILFYLFYEKQPKPPRLRNQVSESFFEMLWSHNYDSFSF